MDNRDGSLPGQSQPFKETVEIHFVKHFIEHKYTRPGGDFLSVNSIL
jgi:hypothetical protein